MGQVQWRAVRQGSGTVDTDLYDLRPLTEAFNRNATSVTAFFEDRDGTKLDDYPRSQRVELQYSTNGGSSYTTRLAAVVQDTSQGTTDGFPALKVDCVGYNHFLRREDVYKTYSSKSISAILEDLVKNFTPVGWNSAKVDIVNDVTISREFRGIKVDAAIEFLLSISADEEYLVDDSLEFVVSEQDAGSAPALGDTDIIDHDLPTRGKYAVNEVQIFYGGGDSKSFVIVEDRPAQRELKNKLDAPRNVVVGESDTFPEIASEDQAKNIARQILDERSELRTGELTTFRRFDTEVGDVFPLTLSSRNISGEEFRVAQLDYFWQRGETVLTIAENAPDIDRLLVGLSDSVKNTRARDADPSATGTRFLDLRSGVELSVSLTVIKRTIDDTFVLGEGQSTIGDGGGFLGDNYSDRTTASADETVTTTTMLDECRELWQGGASPGLSALSVGDDNTAPDRTDSSLQSQLRRFALDRLVTDGATGFMAEASADPGGAFGDETAIEEIGLHDATTGGSMFARTTLPATDHGSDTETIIRLSVSIADDSDLRGVITTTGQTTLRDLLIGDGTAGADNPQDMVYGTDGSAAAVGDTALGGKAHEDTIDSFSDRSTGRSDIVERISSQEANGNDLAEVGYQNDSDELLARVAFEALSKTSSFALETNYRYLATNS